MVLTPLQTLGMILAIAAGALLTRALPFVLFPQGKNQPPVVGYLGRVLPPAMMGLLVVYCLKGVSIKAAPYGAPELLALALIVLLQRWRHNVLLSIGAGTALYMFLVQVVFV